MVRPSSSEIRKAPGDFPLALANVLQHSNASEARLDIHSLDDDNILLSVDDNGIGIPSKAEREPLRLGNHARTR